MRIKFFLIIFFIFSKSFSQEIINGNVSYINNDNQTIFLEGVNIYWKNSNTGVISDKNGNFSISRIDSTNELVFKILGFKKDTVEINSSKFYSHKLTPESDQLNEVIVSKRKNTIQKSYFKTQNIVNVSSDELLKAACCNVSESFETNPSIDVNFSNAITGVKEVKMLGLESPYLMITEENIPMVRGASQVFGLSFVPGPWVESMQITKGVGSVVNGFESISGQINIELKKPIFDEPFFFNLFTSDMGRFELNFHMNEKINEKLSSSVFLHADKNSTTHDDNFDGFLDHPKYKGFNIFNRWQYTDLQNGLVGFFSLKILKDEKETGEDVTSLLIKRMPWLSEINTQRFDTNFKIGYVNPNIPYQSLGFQFAYSNHDQNSFFGLRNYNIKHNSLYSNLIYNSIIGNTMHKFKSGFNYSYDDFDELVDSTKNRFERVDKSFGAFFEYSYDDLEKLSMIIGLRYDLHNNLGSFLTPRFHFRYQPMEKSVIRFSVGSGRKSSNIYSENQEIFSTGRKIFNKNNLGKFYGLDPEIAWNYGFSFRQGFSFNNKEGDITLDYYITDFKNQVIVDWEKQGELHFYNLDGKSYSKSFQLEIDYQLTNNMKLKSAYKNFNVKKQYNSGLKQNPLTPKNRFFINLDYSTKKDSNQPFWRFDFTYNSIGNQRLPAHTDQKIYNEYSPSYFLINAQVTRIFSNKFEIYLGGENLNNYTQKSPILDNSNPFGTNFDSTLIFAPIQGYMYYLGLRLKL